jgi:hypothetical protein
MKENQFEKMNFIKENLDGKSCCEKSPICAIEVFFPKAVAKPIIIDLKASCKLLSSTLRSSFF